MLLKNSLDWEHAFLPNKTPNLGNLRRIDLKKIAEEPSAEFLRFLADWRNSLVS